MTEEKAKRLIISTTVGAILLLFVLISVMVYQLIAIRVENKKKAELMAKETLFSFRKGDLLAVGLVIVLAVCVSIGFLPQKNQYYCAGPVGGSDPVLLCLSAGDRL